jgi:hypothetical protein
MSKLDISDEDPQKIQLSNSISKAQPLLHYFKALYAMTNGSW